MIEKEIKILDINVDNVCGVLHSFGAQQLFSGWILDLEFKHTKEKTPYKFRLRKTNQYAKLTMKRRTAQLDKETYKVREEIEVTVPRKETYASLLEQGFVVSRVKYKKRLSYRVDDVIFDIDMYPSLPPLLEIEHGDDQVIRSWISKLGLHGHKQSVHGTKKLFAAYGKKKLHVFA